MRLNKILCMQFAFLIGKVLTQKWQPNPTYEYYLSSQKKSFDEAQSSCRQSPDGADLVMIKTLEIQTFIEGIIPEGTNFYLGMKYTGRGTGKPSDYQWLDGTNVADGYHNFPNFLIDEYVKQCGVWYRGDKAWKNEKCEEERNYVCQRLIASSATTATTKSILATTATPATTHTKVETPESPEKTTEEAASIVTDSTTKKDFTTFTCYCSSSASQDYSVITIVLSVIVAVCLCIIAILGICLFKTDQNKRKQSNHSNVIADSTLTKGCTEYAEIESAGDALRQTQFPSTADAYLEINSLNLFRNSAKSAAAYEHIMSSQMLGADKSSAKVRERASAPFLNQNLGRVTHTYVNEDVTARN